MKGNRKKGFTLTELIVVLVIFAILLAVAIPSALYYIKLAEFRKNEENAKTIYMAAESALTWQRSSGEWESFREQVMKKGTLNDSFKSEAGKEDKREGRIYAITLDAKTYGKDQNNLVVQLIDELISDKSMLSDGAIAIEIDVESGQVYSAFYGTRRSKIGYGADEDAHRDTFDMNKDNREYESRRERLLGYYSVDDVTNVVNLKPTRLKVTSINLVNSETLYLSWSSNSKHDNLDVAFHIAFYEKNTEEKLFELVLDRSELGDWSGEQADGSRKVRLALKDKDGEDKGEWMFPVTYENGTFTLVLDAMMSAKLQAAVDQSAGLTKKEQQKLHQEFDTSITRLAAVAEQLATPQNIYATIQATATYKNMGSDQAEYRQSTTVTSNTANSMYGDKTTGMTGMTGSGTGETLYAKIDTFRHLSNIRYYGTDKDAEFTLNSRNLDWKSVGTGLYDLVPDTSAGSFADGSAGGVLKTAWQSNSDGELDFPSIAQLGEKHTLKGSNGRKTISNLRLGVESVIDDTTAEQTGKDRSAYLGLFCELEGTVKEVSVYKPLVTLTAEEMQGMSGLCGVGIVAGRSSGSMEHLMVAADKADTLIMQVEWNRRSAENAKLPAGAGGIAGILAKQNQTGTAAQTLSPLSDQNSRLENLSVAGQINVTLPTPPVVTGNGAGSGSGAGVGGSSADSADGTDTAVEQAAQGYPYGAGGLFGYAALADGVRLQKCENHANVTANLMAGGIVGHVSGQFDSAKLGSLEGMQTDDVQKKAEAASSLLQCENNGLILCSAPRAHEEQERQIEGRYFGGIAGFIDRVLIYDTDSASGRSSNFEYDAAKKEELLKGQYVGGIAGYGVDSLLLECDTQKDGYILGSDYVGGIVGGLTEDTERKTIGGGIGVTTNAGYVIGNRYVGGIIGKNDGSNQIQYCVNNGVAAGYGKYIGGIVGYNGSKAQVIDCASYVSDYDNSIYNMIVKNWNAVGDYVGGLVGYNNGKIVFDDRNVQIAVKSVASIVVGEDYVGGVIGFNDVDGELEIAYTLISGRTYAYGDCAGGLIGLNASQKILDHEIVVKPQSVRGENCVGGLIGADVVDLDRDVTMENFRADNMLGTVTGQAFVGGLIGYQKTYTADQLGLTIATGRTAQLLAYLENESTDSQARKATLIPGLQKDTNVPTNLVQSQNTKALIIKKEGNTKENLSVASNNLTIRAQVYAGGIVGYCEAGSKLTIENCKNSGNLSQASAAEFNGQALTGVALLEYLNAQGYTGAVTEIQTSFEEGEDAQTLRSGMAGGIIGVNLKGQTIKHCANTGSMSGFTCLGGVVGFNGGDILACELSDNMGNAALDYVGGIAGMNIGTIKDCSTKAGKTVSGRSNVGGVVGYNLSGGELTANASKANVTAAGNYAGGVVGRNGGTLFVSDNHANTDSCTISGRSGKGIGGIAGMNEKSGKILAEPGTDGGTTGDPSVMPINSKMSVIGRQEVGGIVGINRGQLGGTEEDGTGTAPLIVCEAFSIRALETNAGGIAGSTTNDITYMKNCSWKLRADAGMAGGIVPVVNEGVTISHCLGDGDAMSNDGYAGGVAAENHGTIIDCSMKGDNLTISSRNVEYAGAICAVNAKTGVIYDSAPSKNVTLESDASVYGAVAGLNQGRIGTEGSTNITSISYMPVIKVKTSNLTIGGAAGMNETDAVVTNVQCFIDFEEDFSGYRYLGGVVGQNKEHATVTNSSFAGTMKEGSGAAGNCYGGIVGENAGTVSECEVQEITLDIKGVYTATSGNTAEQKEALATHTGGVVGKNETTGLIDHCYIEPNANSRILVDSGMAGGVAGYNKGTIRFSGGKTMIKAVMTGLDQEDEDGKAKDIEDMCKKAEEANVTANQHWVNYGPDNKIIKEEGKNKTYGISDVEDLTYNESNTSVSDGRLQIIMSSNGNLGGITSYNAPTGKVEYCATGKWFLNNKSDAIGVGTGGIIGMNESENDMSFLLNCAFVGRQLNHLDTNRFAGGIIGNQNNTTVSGWKLSDCANYGTVYCYNTHYSGGIIGQWTSSGGTIERCVNYGNLQTTYANAWVGASAGIVAQLYHPYAKNEYNIISCGNFGSIYGRAGDGNGNAANDSAGILGNVTTYKAEKVGDAQRFTIQVLDCLNGPGVKIYSGSMASGIVGFFSSDSPSADVLKKSTANIELRIERCRNFATELNGAQYRAGIFGDRYGNTGAYNTTIKDCYSVTGTSYTDRPIVSLSIPNSSNPALMETGQNYYFDEVTGRSYPGLGVLPKTDDGTGKFTMKHSQTGNVNWQKSTADLRKASGKCVMIFKVGTKNQYQYFVNALIDELYQKEGTIRIEDCYVDPDDGYLHGKYQVDGGPFSENKKLAKVLFYLPEDAIVYTSTSQLTAADSIFYTYVREAYRVQEGYEEGTKKMTTPQNVTAELTDGKMELTIIPDTNTNPKSKDENGKDTKCDPFRYEVTVKVGDVEKVSYLYTETGSVDLPESATGGEVEVTVRACSMYEDVEPSVSQKATINKKIRILPTPDIRIEIVEDSSAGNTAKCKYELSLNNLDAYNAVAEDGTTPLYPGWKVVITYNGKEYIVSKDEPTVEIAGNVDGDKAAKQLIAQAKPPEDQTGDIEVAASASVSTSVYLPESYRPDASLLGWVEVTPSVKVSGTTLEELSIEVALTDNQSKDIPNPPIYGVDLIGTWKKGTVEEKENVVFASADMLVVPDGKVTHTFTGLPEYITEATDLKVRIWFRETGHGPVYTYHEEKTEAEANIIYLNGLDENGKPQYSYAKSVVLEKLGTDDDTSTSWYRRYHYRSDDVITWLDAPVLLNVDANGIGEPPVSQYDEQGNLQYTFYWDRNPTTEFNDKFAAANYKVTLTGIDAQGNRVAITVPENTLKKIPGADDNPVGIGNTAWGVTVDAEDWNFKNVELQVTRIGSSTDANAKIGLTATGNYKVRQRLEKPGQPAVENVSTDELLYNVSWSSITSETGCESYEIFAQPYNADGTLGTPVSIGTVAAQGNGSLYTQPVDLEVWAGQPLRIYVVAKAAAGSQDYVDSAAGVTYDMTLPSRIKTPTIVNWSKSWEYKRENALTQANFEYGTANDSDTTSGLTVELKADEGSIPPGGSVYLLRAYVYDSQANAQSAFAGAEAEANKTHTPNTGAGSGYLTGYIISPDGRIAPVQMDALTQTQYNHTLNGLAAAYAGKWIVFQTRISSGDGKVSSEWVTAPTPYQLPFVKLNAVDVTSQNVKCEVAANVSTNPDLPAVKETWTVEQNAFEWDSVPYADAYYVNVTENKTETGSTTPKTHEFRITEEAGEDGTPTIVVREKGKKADGSAGYEWYDATAQLPQKPVDMSDTEYEEYCKTHKVYLLEGYDIVDFNLDGTVKETQHLGGYQQTLAATYVNNEGINVAYSVTVTARLEAEKLADGRWHYKLVLPDTLSLTDADGIVVGDGEAKCSAKVTFRADKAQNEAENLADKSDAYVSSEEKEVNLD